MEILIENTSSPGASFTPNTNAVLLKTYQWICENQGISLSFKEFRMRLQTDKKVNDNNNRNIYPLLKNGELVSYEKGSDLHVDYFFTNTGLAYVKTLEMIEMIKNEDYTSRQMEDAIKKCEMIKQEIITDALFKVVEHKEVNYVEPFQEMINFIVKYNSISKLEYAIFLYMRKIGKSEDELENVVNGYRMGEFDIEVKVNVRNDIDIRKKTNKDKRKEGLSYLTSYGYFTSLLLQAGLIVKRDKNYFDISDGKKKILEKLGGKNSE